MMITVSNQRLIKRFDYNLDKMNISYLIKTFLCILNNDSEIEIIILKSKKENDTN